MLTFQKSLSQPKKKLFYIIKKVFLMKKKLSKRKRKEIIFYTPAKIMWLYFNIDSTSCQTKKANQLLVFEHVQCTLKERLLLTMSRIETTQFQDTHSEKISNLFKTSFFSTYVLNFHLPKSCHRILISI